MCDVWANRVSRRFITDTTCFVEERAKTVIAMNAIWVKQKIT